MATEQAFGQHQYRSQALQQAEQLRRQGYKTRVVKGLYGNWIVYARKLSVKNPKPPQNRWLKVTGSQVKQIRFRGGNVDVVIEPGAHRKKNPKKPKLGSGKRFARLSGKLGQRPGVYSPRGLAAFIGRKKYGKKKMAKLAKAGKRKSARNARSKRKK